MIYTHTSIGSKSLDETVTNFALAGSLKAPTVVSIDVERNFSVNGEKIRLPTKKFLLCTSAGNLEKSKNISDWTSRNAVLLPLFLTEAVVADGETEEEALLDIFTEKIQEHGP